MEWHEWREEEGKGWLGGNVGPSGAWEKTLREGRETAMSNVTLCQVLWVPEVSHGVPILRDCVEFLTRKEARSCQRLWVALREVQNEGVQV